MDEVDLLICKNLMKNSRLTYRELAQETSLTVNAVHKRVQHLIEIGTIRAFTARPNIAALKGIMVGTWGTTKAKSVDDVLLKLKEHDGVWFVAIQSGKFLYIVAYLRDISELQNYSSFVAKTSEIDHPTVGLINLPYQTVPETLKNVEFKILKSLRRDARKSAADVAEEVGLSTKTVTKAIDRMIKNQLVEFSIDWAPVSENDFITVFYVYLQDNTNINAKYQRLMEKFGKNIMYILTYSNIPDLLTMHTWTRSAQEMQNITRDLQAEGFRDVVPFILLGGRYYTCWLDDLPIKNST